MTGPTSTTGQTPQDHDSDDGADRDTTAPEHEVAGEVGELARTQQDVAQRARRLVAGELVTRVPNGGGDDERAHRLVTAARADLLAELREQEQEQARRQLAEATRSSEDAVAGVVRGVTTIVRGIVPAVLVRPEDVIEATYALADQGLRVSRRLALTVTSHVRSLSVQS